MNQRTHPASGATFYESLSKPSWTPPDWAFPTAWSVLWLLQALALVLVVAAAERPGRATATVLLLAQFLLAIAWQAIVFGPGRLNLAAWWLVVVLLAAIAATVATWRVSLTAGLLVAPTIVWMCVATALGFALQRLNPAG